MPRFDLILMRTGALTIVAGLVTGGFVTAMRLPTLALAAHLTGMGDGLALMVFAVVWPELALSRGWSVAGRWLAATSMPGVWLGLTVAAATGAGRAAPMLGGARSAGPLWDAIASGLIVATSLMALAAAVILAVGLLLLRSGREGEIAYARP
jgi:hydroxylaminobenzene mutase